MRTITACLCAVALVGCATKRYGRMQPLTDTERSEYSCRDIRIELAKLDAFRSQVIEEGRFNAKTVLGFAGDFGIGNGMEKREALRTGVERRKQLESLDNQRRCWEQKQESSQQ